jgi:hypothetical protein
MFEKSIEFITTEEYLQLEKNKDLYPSPIKLNIPEWYKKLKHTHRNLTVKGCMPFLDTLTNGYLLKIPQDVFIHHNFENDKGRKDSVFKYSLHECASYLRDAKINLNDNALQVHATSQLEGSPYIQQNKEMPFYKILNPWVIKTPPGYSCLFTSPLNNGDDRFFIIPGIVDTDKFNNEINFPIIINGDKYSELETTIKKGTPYVQIIPFKRDSWKMSIKTRPTKKALLERVIYDNVSLFRRYQNFFWQKKEYK